MEVNCTFSRELIGEMTKILVSFISNTISRSLPKNI